MPVAAAVATGLAALLSYLPVAVAFGLVQAAGDAGTLAGAARLGLAGWLLGHGVPLGTSVGPVGLTPLALAGLATWRVVRAGVHTSRAIGARRSGSLRQAFLVAGAIGTVYGLIGGLVAVVVDGGGITASWARAAATFAGFGTAGALVGALQATEARDVLAARTPDILRDGVRTGVVAALLLVGAGAGSAGLAVATGGGEASDMIGAYRTGVAGQAGVTLVSVAYAPNAAVWAAAYLLGPGFAVGADSVVRTTEVTLGTLPAVPLLAGLPHGPVGGLGAALLAVPVIAGMAGGCLLAGRTLRATPAAAGWAKLLAAAATAGPVAAATLGLAAFVSGGPLGGGRLAEIGPVGWQVGAAGAILITLGALVGAAATRVLAGR